MLCLKQKLVGKEKKDTLVVEFKNRKGDVLSVNFGIEFFSE